MSRENARIIAGLILWLAAPAARADINQDALYQGFTPSYYNGGTQAPLNAGAGAYDDWGAPAANPFMNNNYGGGGGYYNSAPVYGGQGSAAGGPRVSINLNPQESLNADFRIAARENRVDDVRKFLEQGAAINSSSESGETALMYAARYCWPKVSSVLLASHADVNVKNRLGKTALMFAALGTCAPVARQLLAQPGIRLELADLLHKTAADYAGDAAVMEVGGPAEDILHLLDSTRARRARAARAAHRERSSGG